MGLFDAISGAASERAYKKNAAVIGQLGTAGGNALADNYAAAHEKLFNPNGGSALTALGTGYGLGTDALKSQYGETQGFLARMQDLYGGQTAIGLGATNSLQDALGQNGAEGLTRAKSEFQNSLGYNAGLDTGLDSVMRLASARGNLAGGNTTRDLFNYGADYQNKQSGDFLTRLSGLASNYGTGIAGQAAGLTGQAGASQAQGSALANLGQAYGQGMGGVYQYGAGLNAQAGNAAAGFNTDLAKLYTGNNNALAQSQNQASANFFGALLGTGNLLASPVGQNGATGTVGGSAANWLTSLFK